MISAGEFRNGVTFEQDGQVLQVVEFQHEKDPSPVFRVIIRRQDGGCKYFLLCRAAIFYWVQPEFRSYWAYFLQLK